MLNSLLARCRSTPSDEGDTPDDLALFRTRMASQGNIVRLPSAGSDYEFPDAVELKGELLSETVVRLRGEEP